MLAYVHACVITHFSTDRNLAARAIFKRNHDAAPGEWRQLGAAKGQASRPC